MNQSKTFNAEKRIADLVIEFQTISGFYKCLRSIREATTFLKIRYKKSKQVQAALSETCGQSKCLHNEIVFQLF